MNCAQSVESSRIESNRIEYGYACALPAVATTTRMHALRAVLCSAAVFSTPSSPARATLCAYPLTIGKDRAWQSRADCR